MHGAVVFFDMQPGLKLALWPRSSMTHHYGVLSCQPNPTEFLLSHNVASADEVDALMTLAETAGAKLIQRAQKVFWGGYGGCFQDPDGHLWEIVWNPQWQISA